MSEVGPISLEDVNVPSETDPPFSRNCPLFTRSPRVFLYPSVRILVILLDNLVLRTRNVKTYCRLVHFLKRPPSLFQCWIKVHNILDILDYD